MKGTKPVQALRIVWEKTLTLALSRRERGLIGDLGDGVRSASNGVESETTSVKLLLPPGEGWGEGWRVTHKRIHGEH